MRTNATFYQLETALNDINAKFDGNIIFNRLEQKTAKTNIFTLKVKDSKKAGHRLGYQRNKDGNRRKLINACWHVHGEFFDALFDIDENIFIWSGKSKITKDFGNWQDRNIGSIMYPLYFSEACECN